MVKLKEKAPKVTKVKDKWRAKQWYKIRAPAVYNKMEIGETPADTPEKVIGRTVEVTVQELTGDFSKIHMKLQFRIIGLQNNEAHTEFIGHTTTSDYIRRLTRRKRSKIEADFVVTTKDNISVHVKPIAAADKRIQHSQTSLIRNIMGRVVQEFASTRTLDEFAKDLVGGELVKAIASNVKVIYPLKKIEIQKTEVISAQQVGVAQPGRASDS